MASLLRALLLCIFMATVTLLLLQDVAARELAQTGPAATSPGGRGDEGTVGSVNRRWYFSRRGREANEVRQTCDYLAPVSYCCHIYDVPMCYYSKHDCQLNCVKEVPPNGH